MTLHHDSPNEKTFYIFYIHTYIHFVCLLTFFCDYRNKQTNL